MNSKWIWLDREDLETELLEACQEGREVGGLKSEFERLMRLGLEESGNQSEAEELLDRVQAAPLRADYPYQEPDGLEAIRDARPAPEGEPPDAGMTSPSPRPSPSGRGRPQAGKEPELQHTGDSRRATAAATPTQPSPFKGEETGSIGSKREEGNVDSKGEEGNLDFKGEDGDLDRLHGAWTGRCCGCLLGKPVEGWRRERMWGYLKDTGRWPLAAYFSKDAPEGIREKYGVRDSAPFRESVFCMPEDDDTNYTVCGLGILEKYGRGFSPNDVAEFWTLNLPILRTCTAERVAYRNILNGVLPPKSASHRNPYREWVGAQIRADFWGYVNPGDPERAAELAWRDACVSHVKNGIYGEMWAAAMVSAAFATNDIEAILRAGLEQIPANCRLADGTRRQMSLRQTLSSAQQAIDDLHSRWDENRAHDWCHVAPNAEVVALALLWGEGDFGRSICLAVQACFDTDCNGATVGSILGAKLGMSRLPAEWTSAINDTLETGVQGFARVRLCEMAERTLRLSSKKGGGR